MKTASTICIALLVIWTLVAIADMWFNVISTAVFIKMTITFGLIAVVALAVALARREYVEEQQMRKDKYID